MALQARIETYAGDLTGITTDHLVTDAIYDVAKRSIAMKPESFYEFSTETTFTSIYAISEILGIDAVRHISRASRPCIYISPDRYDEALDVNSIYYATAFSPVWTYQDTRIKVLPLTGLSRVEVIIPDSTITIASDNDIDNFPSYFYDVWAMHVAMGVLANKLALASDSIGALSLASLNITSTFPTDEAVGAIGIQIKPDFLPAMTVTDDFSAYITEMNNFIDTDWDETLANAKAQEVSTRIQDYLSQIDGQLKEWQAKLSEYSEANSRYALALQRYQADVGIEVQEYSASVQEFSTELQGYVAEMQALSAQYQMVKDLYMSQWTGPEVQQYDRRRPS